MQEWFKDAKFGVFITWGIYSLGQTSESWDMFNGVVGEKDYVAQAAEFSASEYDPQAWARLFKQAGARYAVLTAKHHDGFALWDSAVSDWTAAKASPAGRDLVGPYAHALRELGLKVGLYFSHSDWLHPDYASMTPQGPQAPIHDSFRSNAYAYPQHGDDPQAWQRYLTFHRAQLKEICTRYRPDLLWFDGDWERDVEQWDCAGLRDQLHEWSPGVVLNSRVGGNFGDYSTPEQALPTLQPEGEFELALTMNDNWGYRVSDQNFKTPEQCLELLIETVSMGGNLLLDIGPTHTGEIKPVYADALRYMGDWLQSHGEAIYGSRAGLPAGHFWGPSTRSPDGKTLYLFVFGSQPQISVKGLMNKATRITVLGHEDRPLNFAAKGGAWWVPLPGFLWVEIKPELMHPHVSVLKVELDSPLELWRGLGDQIRHNV